MEEEEKKFIYRAVDFAYAHIKTMAAITVFIVTTSVSAYNKYTTIIERIDALEAKVAADELEIEKLIYAANGKKSLPLPNLKPLH